MLTITIDLVKDALAAGQKRELVARISQAASAVQGEALSDYVHVRIQEYEEAHCHLGGAPLTAVRLNRMAGSKVQSSPPASTGAPSRRATA